MQALCNTSYRSCCGCGFRPAPERQTTPYWHRAWITPHPPQGGFERASNITPVYAPSSLLVRRAAGRPARPTPARPHNGRYVKCPLGLSCPGSVRRSLRRVGRRSRALRVGQTPARARSPQPSGHFDPPPTQRVAARGAPAAACLPLPMLAPRSRPPPRGSPAASARHFGKSG
jgi:hypothetical protein